MSRIEDRTRPSSIDASNILKPCLARGEIQIIGATTIDEYRKHVEKDSGLERRFQSVLIEEPSKEDTIEILKGLRDKYEAHHKVKITDESIKAAVDLSVRYITDRFLPDKAIDLIDEAAAKVKTRMYSAPEELDNVNHLEKILSISSHRHDIIALQVYDPLAKVLPNVGLLYVEDAETGHEMVIDTSNKNIRQAHSIFWLNREKKLLNLFNKLKIDNISVATDENYVTKLMQLFKQRY